MKKLLPFCFPFILSSAFFLFPFTLRAKSNSPMLFVENKGQVTDQSGNARSDIDFKMAAASGLNIFIGKGALHYQWVKARPTHTNSLAAGENSSPAPAPVDRDKVNDLIDMYRMDVQLIGANPNAAVTTAGRNAYSERYYLPSVGNDGAVANTYSKITYRDIYPNIDWVFYINADGKLEHDFIVRPGGKVSDIKLQYGGSTSLKVNADGGMTAITPYGDISEQAPYTYEQKSKKKIASSFALDKNTLTFITANYKGTLVIDPVLQWGTYVGDLDYDDANDVQINKDGFIYIVGSTSSIANIATTGAYQTSFGGGSWPAGADAYLARFNSQGNCIWSTYYGGNDIDLGRKITADTLGNLYIAGNTASFSGIATTGTYQGIHGGGLQSYDAFLIKFDTSGQRIWGTYFGGSNDEGNSTMDVVADRSGNIYLTANTESSDLPVTSGAYQSTLTGYDNAFLAKFNTAGQLTWSTYYGGESSDFPYALAVDAVGNIFMTGRTQSSTGIATTGTQQTAIAGGQDAFLAKFTPSGSLQWGTYFGGTALDRGYAVALDDSAHIYIAGTTASPAGIVTIGAQQTTFGGGGNAGDGFIARFNSTGFIDWATYYGGSGGESVFGLRYNSNGAIYLTGITSSTAGIATPGSLQPSNAGGQDIFISRMNATTGALVWGSYYGGTESETATALDADAAGNIYICGKTASGAGIATAGTYQSIFAGGDDDGFLLLLKDCVPPSVPDSITGSLTVCAGSVQHFSTHAALATAYNWILPSGWSGSSDTSGIDITFNNTGGVLKVVAVNACDHSDTASLVVTVNALPPVPHIIQTGNLLSIDQSYASYQWLKNGQPVSGATAATYTMSAGGTYAVKVSNASGCSVTSDPVSLNTTAINDLLAKNGISIFPNPVNEKLSVTIPVKATAAIADMQGRLLKSIPLTTGVNVLDLSDFIEGIYLLRITDKAGLFLGTQKITVRR